MKIRKVTAKWFRLVLTLITIIIIVTYNVKRRRGNYIPRNDSRNSIYSGLPHTCKYMKSCNTFWYIMIRKVLLFNVSKCISIAVTFD